MSRAVGIDLGACNSVVAAMKDGVPVVLPDAEGRRLQPSVVAFGYANTVAVGHRARRQLVHAPESTVLSAKRRLGRRYKSPEVQRMKGTTAFGITEGEDGSVKVRAQGRILAPQEVSAHVRMGVSETSRDCCPKGAGRGGTQRKTTFEHRSPCSRTPTGRGEGLTTGRVRCDHKG